MKYILKYNLLLFLSGVFLLGCNNHSLKARNCDPVLLSNPVNQASGVYLTPDEKNSPMISWAEIDSTGKKSFYFSGWDSVNNTFSPAVQVPISQNMSIHEEGMPKIVVKGDGTIVAVFEVSNPVQGMKWGIGDVQYIQSADKGATWSKPQSVCNNRTAEESMSFSGVARLSDGQIAVSWLDTNSDSTDKSGRPVMFARTVQGGGFSNPVLIEKKACECCRIAVASGEEGQIAIAFRDLMSGNVRDISISTSVDGGKSFDIPNDFSADNWSIDGCPHNGPSVVIGSDGKIYSAWYSGGINKGVHYAELDPKGKLVSRINLGRDSRFIQIALMPDGTRFMAYDENYTEGDSMFSRIVVSKIHDGQLTEMKVASPGKHCSYPMIHALNKEDFVLAWRDGDKMYYRKLKLSDINQPARTITEMPHVNPLGNL